MTERWPSPLPGPAWHAWRQAWDHIETRTLYGVPDVVQAHVLRDPRVNAMLARMSTYAAAGEVTQVQTTAQAWLKVVKQVLAAQQGPQAA